ncbi:hypothetical protein DFJ74DRAFT_327173 [Hyaloraphidium curvatum]|nr:hypothetical protein DFJ74DRAFT_327173 [Hyaloraphidium curvatum]
MAAGPAKPNDGPLRDPGTPGAVGDTDQAAMPLSPTQFASEYLRSLSEATPFLGHGTRGGADAAAMAPFPHGADGSVNIADLASLGLGMGVNFESLDFLHGMEANAAGGSIDGQLRSFRHGSANLGAESIGGSTGGGGSQSGEAATIVDWNSLNLDQQLLLLQQPDFLMAFQNAMASSGAAASAQKVDGVVGPAPEATPGQRDSGRRRHRSVTSAKPGDYVSGGRPAEGSEDLGRSADGPSGAAADDLETTESPPRQPGSKGKRRAGAAEATPGGSSKPSPQRGRGIKSGSAVPDSGVILDEKIEDDRTVRFSPLVSPAMTPSLDFQRMSLAMAYGDGAALSPLSSPALRPTVGDSLDSSTRSPGFGPTRVSVTAKRGPGDGENVASTNFQGLPPPTATTPPYQVPLSGRRRTAKSGGAAQSGGSPALGPAKTSPPSVVRTSSLEQLPEKGQPPSNPALSPPFVFQALSPNDVLSPGSAGAFLPQLYAVPSAASPASMGAVAAGAGSKSDSPLMLAAKGGPVQIQALPPPIMGPPATPASMMNMGRPAQLPPHFVQAPSPASAMLNMGPYRLDMQAGPRFLTPPLGPTDVGLQFQLTDANTPIELRRSSHKVAEQKRRDSLRQCFDNLRDLLPQDQHRNTFGPCLRSKERLRIACGASGKRLTSSSHIFVVVAGRNFTTGRFTTSTARVEADIPRIAIAAKRERAAGKAMPLWKTEWRRTSESLGSGKSTAGGGAIGKSASARSGAKGMASGTIGITRPGVFGRLEAVRTADLRRNLGRRRLV